MSSKAFELLPSIAFLFTGAAFAQENATDVAADSETETVQTAAASDVREESADDETCFDISRVQDISVLSDQHVYVRTIGGNHYLLTMEQTCDNLQRSALSEGVRVQPYGRRVCPNDGSHLIYNWFGRESVCPIQTIDAVEDRQEARAIAEGNVSPVDVEQVTLPE
jgi:hypothetical protein